MTELPETMPTVPFDRLNSRSARTQREKQCQLVALGIVLSNPSMLDELEPSEFTDSALGSVFESLRRLRAGNADEAAKMELSRFLRDSLGVEVGDSEKTFAAVIRTVRENGTRRRAADKVQQLALLAEKWTMSDADFISKLVGLAGEFQTEG